MKYLIVLSLLIGSNSFAIMTCTEGAAAGMTFEGPNAAASCHANCPMQTIGVNPCVDKAVTTPTQLNTGGTSGNTTASKGSAAGAKLNSGKNSTNRLLPTVNK